MAVTSIGILKLQHIALMVWPIIWPIVAVCGKTWLMEPDYSQGLFGQVKLNDGHTLPNNVHAGVLDARAAALEIVSCVLFVIAAIACGLSIYMYGPDKHGIFENDEDTKCYKFNKVFFYFGISSYVLSSIFGVVGCMLFSLKFSVEKMGACWYMCLTTSLFIWLMVCIYLCDTMWKERRKTAVFHTFLCQIYRRN